MYRVLLFWVSYAGALLPFLHIPSFGCWVFVRFRGLGLVGCTAWVDGRGCGLVAMAMGCFYNRIWGFYGALRFGLDGVVM